MIPVLGVPILNRPKLLWEMLDSIDVEVGDIVVVDNGDVVPRADAMSRGISVIRPGYNLGVGASWNMIIKSRPKAPWWLITNFDLTFAPGDLTRLEEHMNAHGGVGFLGGFSAFGIAHDAIERAGWFDENYVPAYFEDNDYDYRCRLSGVPLHALPTGMQHRISSTLKGSQHYQNENARSFPENARYYYSKWGGSPYHEVYTTPFNRGGDLRDWQLDINRLAAQSWTREEQ